MVRGVEENEPASSCLYTSGGEDSSPALPIVCHEVGRIRYVNVKRDSRASLPGPSVLREESERAQLQAVGGVWERERSVQVSGSYGPCGRSACGGSVVQRLTVTSPRDPLYLFWSASSANARPISASSPPRSIQPTDETRPYIRSMLHGKAHSQHFDIGCGNKSPPSFVLCSPPVVRCSLRDEDALTFVQRKIPRVVTCILVDRLGPFSLGLRFHWCWSRWRGWRRWRRFRLTTSGRNRRRTLWRRSPLVLDVRQSR